MMTLLARKRPIWQPSASSATGAPLHTALISEFVTTARLAAVVTSMATARRSGSCLRFLGVFRAYLPPSPHVFQLSFRTLMDASLQPEFVSNLQNYYARLAFISALSDLPDDAWRSGNGLSTAEWQDLENAWCRICALASVVVHHMLELCLDSNPARRDLASIQHIVQLAKDGGRPCVGFDGAVIVPGWLDRRRQDRRLLNWPALLDVDGERYMATLHDVSTDGMGIAGCRMHRVGANLTAALQSGRCLAGRVQWCQLDRLGAKFTLPLALTDPLLD